MCLTYSQSSIGCYISAQAYHKQNQLSLSILDFGIGLLNSLKPFYPDIKDDVEAINKAVLEGVSSKRKLEKRVRGVGLTNISGFLKNRGSMEIISYIRILVPKPCWNHQYENAQLSFKRNLC